MLDLYQRLFEGRPLRPDEYVLCADEKTSIQARERIHPTVAAGPARPALVEHEYERRGALAYLAALDVHRPRLIGRCEEKSGIAPFDRLVEQVMREEPYCSARRVFLIVDNGSAHRGQKSIERLEGRWPNLRLIHLPIHASWLNQIEIYVRHEAPCERRESKDEQLSTVPAGMPAPGRCSGPAKLGAAVARDRALTVGAAPTT